MERTLISQAKSKKGEEVLIKGRVMNLRKLGGLSFILLEDYSGQIQTVWEKEVDLSSGDLAVIKGSVREEQRARGGFEVKGEELISVIKGVEELPFDLAKPELNLNLNTLLDWRILSLRHPKIKAIFKLYGILLETYREAMAKEGFTEIKTPKILGAASEGGANFFKLKYFGKDAFLAQSPQFYKQIMVGIFERVFEVGPVFRAEPHFTTRHVNEYISLDAEMGFIESYQDVMNMLNKVLGHIFSAIKEKGKPYLDFYKAEVPEVLEEIPKVKLSEIKKIIKDKYGYEIPKSTDIDPEGERLAGRYAKEKFNSDFIFLTCYPKEFRPFYHFPNPENKNETSSFDLLFRGVEIVTGSQRIHIYQELLDNMKEKKISPKGMEFYLDLFKFAMPPHGGWGMGLERILQLLLGLGNVKEAVLFPRDVKRLIP